jgi:hypothetical protein
MIALRRNSSANSLTYNYATSFTIYVMAPKSAFPAGTTEGSFTAAQVEKSSILPASGNMELQGVVATATNFYFGFVLNSTQAAMDLSSLNTSWKYVYTMNMSPAPTAAGKLQMKIVDKSNNAELNGLMGGTYFSTLMPNTNTNLLSASAFSILPALMTDFNVTKQGNNAALVSWNSSNEINVKNYVVERSLSPNTGWEMISQVSAKADNSLKASYSYTDASVNISVMTKVVYYRIRIVDMDGAEKISAVRSLQFAGQNGKGVTIYPNPVKEGFYVNVPVLNPADKKIRLNLVSQSGQIVSAREVNASIASNYYFDLTSNGVIAGEYMLQVISEGQILDTKKVMVQR